MEMLFQMSYASVSPLLSDKGTYPRFFRTSAPDTAVNPARIEIIKYFGWKRVATIHHSRAVFDAVRIHCIMVCLCFKTVQVLRTNV